MMAELMREREVSDAGVPLRVPAPQGAAAIAPGALQREKGSE